MRKSDKKMDNQLRITLTDVCELALKDFTGFQWLTHLANYSKFPESLKVICIFDTNDNLSSFIAKNNHHELSTLIQKSLFNIGVSIKSIDNHIAYDSEEDCEIYNHGNWKDRLN